MDWTSQRQTISYDADTGEVLDGTFMYVPKRVKVEDWYMAFQQASMAIASDPDFKLSTYRVLHALLARLDYDNYIVVSQADMARQLNMKRSNVSREIRLLCEKSVLKKGPKSGHQVTFRLNPQYAWRGKTNRLQKAGRDFQVIQGGKSGDQPGLFDGPGSGS